MSKLTCQITMSLDGFVAGPNQSLDEPLGHHGERLHKWAFATDRWQEQHGQTGGEASVDSKIVDESIANVGAVIMGRHMFGGGDGDWDESWRGWWGEDPPYHAPVFVLTHNARQPLPMDGGTTFTFVTDGIESALAQATAAAGDLDVSLVGGADVVQQYIAAGLLDEIDVHIAPLLLGGGTRLFEHLGETPIDLKIIRTAGSDNASHLKYELVRRSSGS